MDEKWTAEALWNMVDNAIKYTPQGGTVSLSAEAHEMFCTIKVRDNGMGIDDQEQSRILADFTVRPGSEKNRVWASAFIYLARSFLPKTDLSKSIPNWEKERYFLVSLPIRATEKVYDF